MDIVELFQQSMKLKCLKRTGWVEKNILNCETVAEHSYGVALLASFVKIPKNINREKLIKMGLLHDLGETIIGDIISEIGTYIDLEKQKDKKIKERDALNHILSKNDELREIAIEYLECKTPTAKFSKELDKLEMIFQALEYETKNNISSLQEFWDNAEHSIQDKELREIYEKLKKLRIISK